ncbi:MAG TPA: hypothetical protein PKD79_01850 [Candidatus Doudnabacteria bacterium]|nr:hypothetical protein [Candidatus Doudnabacteria bacterium]
METDTKLNKVILLQVATLAVVLIAVISNFLGLSALRSDASMRDARMKQEAYNPKWEKLDMGWADCFNAQYSGPDVAQCMRDFGINVPGF